MRNWRRAAVIVAALTAAVLAGGAGAYAVLVGRTGTFSEKQHFLSQTDAFSTTNARYTTLPGASRTVVVPAGTRRMLDARFTAESQCVGSSGWCTVRIIVVHPSGAQTELAPASGLDFAFDSATPAADQWEGHAIERTSPFLPAGTYRVVVQTRVVAGATRVRLDDWSLAVEVIRP